MNQSFGGTNQPFEGPVYRPGSDLWVWGPGGAPRRTASGEGVQVRIGDAERDTAIAMLGDHFAAGRLSREELDERIDRALQARFRRDLDPLFVDLPATRPAGFAPQGPTAPGGAVGAPTRQIPQFVYWLGPLLFAVSVVLMVSLGSPVIFWFLLWMMLAGRFWGRRWHSTGHGQHRQRYPGPG